MSYMVAQSILQRCKSISKSFLPVRSVLVPQTGERQSFRGIQAVSVIRSIHTPLQCNNHVKKISSLLSQQSIHTGNQAQNEGPDKKPMLLPPLMDFPHVMWPKFTNSIRNWFFTHFVIKPYFDKEFSIHEFMQGAHEAIALVASKLSSGELDDLEGLVEPTTLNELRQKLSNFSVAQQDLLRVATEDIFFSFPYQIGIIIPEGPEVVTVEGENKPPQTRHVEITVVLHVLRGMAEMQKKTDPSNFSIIDFTKDESNKYKVMICNYRFFRDFTVGCKDPTWIVNMVNHFLPAEVNQQ